MKIKVNKYIKSFHQYILRSVNVNMVMMEVRFLLRVLIYLCALGFKSSSCSPACEDILTISKHLGTIAIFGATSSSSGGSLSRMALILDGVHGSKRRLHTYLA